MDSAIDPKIEKQSIYEIYRACRLCGAGAGYKMPIIQNVVDLDDRDVQLKEKILDCVQIEVHQDDKMPPLICELCVDKINDFYEFLDMCKQTNMRTRLRLGLPLQTNARGAANDDCILGMTEAIYVDSDDNGEALSKNRKTPPQNRVRIKKSSELKRVSPSVKLDLCKEGKSKKGRQDPSKPRSRISNDSRVLVIDSEDDTVEPRTTRTKTKPRDPTPPRSRLSRSSKDDIVNSQLQMQPSLVRSPKVEPKSILKKEKDLKIVIKREDQPTLVPRLKRMESIPPAPDTPPKKVKISAKSVKLEPKPSPRSTPKSSPKPKSLKGPAAPRTPAAPKAPAAPRTPAAPRAPAAPTPPQSLHCPVCNIKFKSSQAYSSHKRMHYVNFTDPKNACNACREWFPTWEESQAHHRSHRETPTPYTCRHCFADFHAEDEYEKHFGRKLCIPVYELSDIKCDECWHLFPTQLMYNEHRCGGEAGRRGGKCYMCNKSYWMLRDLLRHEMTCSSSKKKWYIDVDEDVLVQLKPIQIRLARCDPLLRNPSNGHHDVSTVPPDYGYDASCIYPFYFSKCTLDGMVSIDPTIKEELSKPEYSHWDSDSESETPDALFARKTEIEPLRTLALKTIFSHKFLGKIPKKIKRMNDKTVFDSLFNDNDDDVRRNIDNIIDKLGLDDEPQSDRTVNEHIDVNGVSELNDIVPNHDKNDSGCSNDLEDKPSVNDTEQINVSDTTDVNVTAKEDGVDSMEVDANESKKYTSNVNGNDVSVDQEITDLSVSNVSVSVNKDNVSVSKDNVSVSKDNVSVSNDNGVNEEDDKALLDELDAQIANNSSNASAKIEFNKVKSKSKMAGDAVKDSSADLDSVSEGELDFD